MTRLVAPTAWEAASRCPYRYFGELEHPTTPAEAAGTIFHSFAEDYVSYLVGNALRADATEAEVLRAAITGHEDYETLDERWRVDLTSWIERFVRSFRLWSTDPAEGGIWLKDGFTELKVFMGPEGGVAKREHAISDAIVDFVAVLGKGKSARKWDIYVLDYKTGEDEVGGEGTWERPGKIPQSRDTSMPHDMQLRWLVMAVAARFEKVKRIKAAHWYARTGHVAETSWIPVDKAEAAMRAALAKGGEIASARDEFDRLCELNDADAHDELPAEQNAYCTSCSFYGAGCPIELDQDRVAQDILHRRNDPGGTAAPPDPDPAPVSAPVCEPVGRPLLADLREDASAQKAKDQKTQKKRRKETGAAKPTPPEDLAELFTVGRGIHNMVPAHLIAGLRCRWPLSWNERVDQYEIRNERGGWSEVREIGDHRAVRGAAGGWEIWHVPTETRLPLWVEGVEQAKAVIRAHADGLADGLDMADAGARIEHSDAVRPEPPIENADWIRLGWSRESGILEADARDAFLRAFDEKLLEHGVARDPDQHVSVVPASPVESSFIRSALALIREPRVAVAVAEWTWSCGATIVPLDRTRRLCLRLIGDSVREAEEDTGRHEVRDLLEQPPALPAPQPPAEPAQEEEAVSEEQKPKVSIKLQRVDRIKDQFWKILLAGPAKVGKTRATLDAFCDPAAPDAVSRMLMFDLEDGSRHYGREWAFTRVMEKGWDKDDPERLRIPMSPQTIMQLIGDFTNNLPNTYETLVIDSVTVLRQLLEQWWVDVFMSHDRTSPGHKGPFLKLQTDQRAVMNREFRRSWNSLREASHNVVIISHVAPKYQRMGKMFEVVGERIDAGTDSEYEFDTVIQIERESDGELWARTIGDRSNRMPHAAGDKRWRWTQDALRRAMRGDEVEVETMATIVAMDGGAEATSASLQAADEAAESARPPEQGHVAADSDVEAAPAPPIRCRECGSITTPESGEPASGDAWLCIVCATSTPAASGTNGSTPAAAEPQPFDVDAWRREQLEQGVVRKIADAFDGDLEGARTELTFDEWTRLPPGAKSDADIPELYGQPEGVTEGQLREIIRLKKRDGIEIETLRGVLRKVTGNMEIDSAKQLTGRQAIYTIKYLAMTPF